ncbi:MAG: maleylpyruvate isomerase N-terminal domain-containing protein [Anaerolineales bacterium]
MRISSTFQSIIQENAAVHEHLTWLVSRLTEDDLSRPIEAGWTVAAALAHLAFWDSRAILLIEKWQREGIGPSPADTDIINDAAKELCLAIPPRKAAELAVQKSLEINRVIEALTPAMVEGIQTIGTAVHLARFEHKRMHLMEIEQVAGKG